MSLWTICTAPVDYANDDIESKDKTDKYEKYKLKNYTPTIHEYMELLKKVKYTRLTNECCIERTKCDIEC